MTRLGNIITIVAQPLNKLTNVLNEGTNNIDKMEMESEDPVRRRPIPTRVKIIMTCIMLALSAGAIILAVFVGKREGFEAEKWPKPFGLGVGPAFIAGQDTTWAGVEFVFDLYAAYRRYNLVTGKTTNEDQEYYER
jgi:hypothetical protein